MKVATIIPARHASSRFPGKPLTLIGARTLLEHTWRAAKLARYPVWIATDSDEIADTALAFGADVVKTGDCNNGTERCAEAIRRLKIAPAMVINWQGDSPLVPAEWARALIEALEERACDVATPVQRASAGQIQRLKHDFLIGVPGGTTAVIGDDWRAIYFSKAVVPLRGPYFFHVGLYAYRLDALVTYGKTPGMLESSEGLEQLRFLEKRKLIRAVLVDGPPIWEVNNPDDVRIVRDMMEERNAAA